MDLAFQRRASGQPEMSGQVKITRVNGTVEYQDIPQDGIEMYDLDGILSSTYPEGFKPGLIEPATFHRWLRLTALGAVGVATLYGVIHHWPHGWQLGAIVWTDKGQEKNVDVIDPATRAAQVTTYYGAWGSSATAPAVGNTTLGTELAEARVATTITQPATNTIQFLWEVTASGNRTVNEFGVLTASSSGDLWIRGTLSTLNIETGDRVEFTIQLLFRDVSE